MNTKKKVILVRDNWTCVYCGVKETKLTLDHMTPRCYGGNGSFSNLVASCSECNGRKDNKTLIEFLKEIT